MVQLHMIELEVQQHVLHLAPTPAAQMYLSLAAPVARLEVVVVGQPLET